MAQLAPRAGFSNATRAASRLALALAAAWLLYACDNPACVFGPDGCNGSGSGGSSGLVATAPVDGQWIQFIEPTLTGTIPASTTTQLHPDSPIGLVFSESMSGASLANSVFLQDTASGGLGAPVQIATTLVADGRLLVIAPLQALTLGAQYQLAWLETAKPVDLQGQALKLPSNFVIGTFTVASTAPTPVRLLGTFPPALAIQQSGVGEFVALFDRKLNPLTITLASFDFKVNGVDPTFDALPQPLSLPGPTGVAVSDTRGYRWRSVDNQGLAAPLPPGQELQCSMSPAGAKISAADGSLLVPVIVRIDIASVSQPLSAEIVSLPTDAIGIDNVSGPKTLDIAVTLVDAQVDDKLGVYVFGNSLDLEPKLVALFRELTLSTTATVVHVTEDDLDLANDLGEGRLADGPLHLAFQQQRGSIVSPLRLLDADFSTSGVQTALFDTTRPSFVAWGSTGTDTVNFRSDLRDFALIGRASERIRSVEVATALGNNGVLTPAVGGTPAGLFVAAPVLLGTLTPAQMPLAFTATIYDNAYNAAAAPIPGSFRQLGASGPGAPLPGATITVEVFDAATLAALPNALVMTHEDVGGGTVFPVDAQVTDGAGLVTLSAGGSGDTLVSVDLAGYDLFTFEDVPTDRLSIPLSRTGSPPASIVGTVSTTNGTLPTIDRFAVDSRGFAQDEPLIPVGSCTQNPATGGYDCPFGPGLIRSNRIGITSVFGVEIPATEINYNVATFLRAFQIAIPVPQVGGGAASTVKLVVDTLLNDPTLDVEERGIDGPALSLDLNSTSGIDLGALDGDPRVLVQAQVRGHPGAGTVGLGVAFAGGANLWSVRCAYPGTADGIQDTPQDALGKLVTGGVIDPDLRLSIELRDTFGARVGRRTPFSLLGATLRPVSAPLILSPAPGASTGGASFDLVFSNAIPNAAGTPGLYRASLVAGGGGRGWTLWRPDLNDASGPSRTIHVPDLAALGGIALPNGAITAVVEAFGWAGFASDDFQWSDVEREYDSFSSGVPSAFTQP